MSLVLAGKVEAADYQDWWWNSDESGRGLNISQQGNTIFAAWFTYDESGEGIWVTLTGQLSSNTVTADLIRATGPRLGERFDPTAVIRVVVGQGTLTFSDLHHASFNYTLNGISGSIPLQRFSFAPLPIEGAYLGGIVINRSGCSFTPNELYAYTANYSISTNGLDITIIEDTDSEVIAGDSDSGIRCTYSGEYQQQGSRLVGSGTFACSDGLGGAWFADDLTVRNNWFTGKMRTRNTSGETCQSAGTISAIKY